jgi:hypothetical protein
MLPDLRSGHRGILAGGRCQPSPSEQKAFWDGALRSAILVTALRAVATSSALASVRKRETVRLGVES